MTSVSESCLSAFERGVVAVPLDSFTAWQVSGADALRYAQGRITQNIRDMGSHEVRNFMLLTPQGRPVCVGTVARQEHELLFVVENSNDEERDFIKSFLRFKVSDDVQCQVRTQAITLLIGAELPKLLAALGTDIENNQYYQRQLDSFSFEIIPISFGNKKACYLVCEAHERKEILTELGKLQSLISVDSEAYDGLRIYCGVASNRFELAEKIVATELAYEPYIAFDKGCYSGQEVVEMSIARGRPNRQLVHLAVEGQVELTLPVDVQHEQTKVGKVTSICSVPTQQRRYCLALIKQEFSSNEDLQIAGSSCERIG